MIKSLPVLLLICYLTIMVFGIPTSNHFSCLQCESGDERMTECLICNGGATIRMCHSGTDFNNGEFNFRLCLMSDFGKDSSTWICCSQEHKVKSQLSGERYNENVVRGRRSSDTVLFTDVDVYDNNTIFYILLPVLFVFGFVIGVLCCCIAANKEQGIKTKLKSLCCRWRNRKWSVPGAEKPEIVISTKSRRSSVELLWHSGIRNNITSDMTHHSNRSVLQTTTQPKSIERLPKTRSIKKVSFNIDSGRAVCIPNYKHRSISEDCIGVLDGAFSAANTTVENLDSISEELESESLPSLDEFLDKANDWAEKAVTEGWWKDYNLVSKRFAAGLFNHEGGRLTIKEFDVDLFIPPGALTVNCRPELIYICVSSEPKRSAQATSQLSASPTIYCGPDRMSFNEHLVLSYQHCALSSDTNVNIVTMCTDTGADEQPDFRDISNDETCFNLVKTDKCYIYIRHFTGFTSVADKKVMDVMCYTGDIPQDKHHLNVRMYCANQTDDAKQLVRNKEHQLKGIQLGRSDQIIVDCKNTHSLQFKMKDIMEGWVIDSGTQKVLDHSVLKFHLYGSISYEMTRNTTMTGFHSNVDIFQHENEQFNEQCPMTIALNINVETQGNESENEPTEDGIKKKRRTNPFLSRNERVGISILLDSNNPLGNDWRLLASSVGLDVNSIRQLEIMAHQKVIRSPTMEVLTFWEAQVNESDSNQLGELKRILECDMQRLDAAEIISK